MHPRPRKYGQTFDSERVVLGRLFSAHESETSVHMRRQRAGQNIVPVPCDGPSAWEAWT
jgi:hypothetical protein